MASTQEPEVQFAQRLASNEKPVRTKALKRLRKYVNVRSQKAAGGFKADELLKLWKGLFYCLWMQDKPLLQEQLSNQISTLIHSFHNISGQLLYLESFLQTFKREWNGIDRLRMDKFFQLVRFMIRQMFELLKRRNWDSSVVGRFLELLMAQLLQSGSAAPSELQFHILDLYMTELAAVGSAELTAEQNLVFIEPFCTTAAKTKDRVLFGAICSSIFSTIINQAPFAIEDLIKEVKALEDCDSGQGSEEDYDGEQMKRSNKEKQVNGSKSDNYLAAELPCDDDDNDIGPVLQFDYASLADKLLELASQSGTPSYNRQKLYRIIKVLRDLTEGIFPQDECPEDMSTDEDDDMFGSRKKMKRVVALIGEEEGAPLAKRRRKKKVATMSIADCEKADLSANNQKKRRKKKKAGQGVGGEENLTFRGQSVTVPPEGLRHSEMSVTGEASKDQSPSMKKTMQEMGKEWQTLPTKEPEGRGVETTQEETTTPVKKKNKVLRLNGKPRDTEGGSGDGLSSAYGVTLVHFEQSTKKKCPKTDEEGEPTAAKVPSEMQHHTTTKPLKEKSKKCVGQKEMLDQTLKAATDQITKKRRVKQKTPKMTAGQEQAGGDERTMTMADKKKKEPNENIKIQDGNQMQVDGELPLDEPDAVPFSRKKRKIPVMFEYEAAEKISETKLGNDAGEPSSTLSKTKPASDVMNDFITFQSNVSVSAPLFCKAKGPRPLQSNKKKCQTPKSVSKKVTFGLKSNKTAEFRKSDRSLLLNPDGSSHVPFDPKQKPKFGVLKSPSMPSPNFKTSFNTPKSSSKQRPSAADFF